MIAEYIRSPAGEEYHRAELREVASQWHGGQWSALYAFSSSGAVVDGLGSEAQKCADTCEDACESDKLMTIAGLERD